MAKVSDLALAAFMLGTGSLTSPSRPTTRPLSRYAAAQPSSPPSNRPRYGTATCRSIRRRAGDNRPTTPVARQPSTARPSTVAAGSRPRSAVSMTAYGPQAQPTSAKQIRAGGAAQDHERDEQRAVGEGERREGYPRPTPSKERPAPEQAGERSRAVRRPEEPVACSTRPQGIATVERQGLLGDGRARVLIGLTDARHHKWAGSATGCAAASRGGRGPPQRTTGLLSPDIAR